MDIFLSNRCLKANGRQIKNLLALTFILLYSSAPRALAEEVTLLVGPQYADELINTVRHARHEVWIGTYVFRLKHKGTTGELAHALSQAARRGVKVRVFLEKTGRKDSLERQNQQTAKWLRKNHVLVHFDSTRVRSHEKIAVIDQKWCFVGSHNLTESALKYNYEVSLKVSSRVLARKLKNSLNQAFR